MKGKITIYRRADSAAWQARWWDPLARKMQRRSLKTTDRNIARRKADDLEHELTNGQIKGGVTVDALGRRYLALQSRRVTRRHLVNQRCHVRRFLDACPVVAIRDVRPPHFRDFLDALRLSPATVNAHRRTLHGMFQLAEDEEWILINLVRKVKPQKEPQKLIVYLTPAERDAVLEKVAGTSLEVPVEIAAGAGLRRGEVCALRWRDVDFDRHVLLLSHSMTQKRRLVPLKNRKEREVPLSARLEEVLARARTRSAFVAIRGRMGWDPSNLTRAVSKLGKRLGVEKMNGLHILRRTFATLLVTAGEPMAQVSEWLGHSSVSVTERRYARFMPGRRGKIDDI